MSVRDGSGCLEGRSCLRGLQSVCSGVPAGCSRLGLVGQPWALSSLLAPLVSPTQGRPKLGFNLGGSDSNEYACNAGDGGLMPRLERSPGGGNGTPLQYSCWEIPWTEEPGGLQPVESQLSQTQLST